MLESPVIREFPVLMVLKACQDQLVFLERKEISEISDRKEPEEIEV